MPEHNASDEKAVVFWAKASSHQIANWQPEKFEGGRMVQPEEPLRFYDHVLSVPASEKKKLKFVRESLSYQAGDVIECEDGMDQARVLTEQHGRLKRVTQLSAVDEENQGLVTPESSN